jgi:hypothetical protein
MLLVFQLSSFLTGSHIPQHGDSTVKPDGHRRSAGAEGGTKAWLLTMLQVGNIFF